jgi:hypothetical protein
MQIMAAITAVDMVIFALKCPERADTQEECDHHHERTSGLSGKAKVGMPLHQ